MTTWNYDEKTKTLTISGTGDMENYDENFPNQAPWFDLDIEKVVIEDGVTSIGSFAFFYAHYCSAELTSVTIPKSVKSIGSDAFRESGLTSVTIPDSVTSIGGSAFYECSSLISVTIPDSVTSIGWSAFECTPWLDAQLETSPFVIVNNIVIASDPETCVGDIVIPDGVTTIGTYAFFDCSNLTSVTIPGSVKNIDYGTFDGCTDLTSVVMSDGVTSIGDEAFSDCESLTSVTIPDSVTYIGGNAFDGTPWLDAQLKTTPYVVVNNIIIASNSETCVGDIDILDSVTSIGVYAFAYCSDLTSVTIPDSVTEIGKYAFKGCSNLTSITIPVSVTSIGYEAFYGCSSLTSVTIPNSVTSIGNCAFENCSNLTSIIISDRVTSTVKDALSKYENLKLIVRRNIETDKRVSDATNMSEDLDYNGKCGIEGDNLIWSYDINSGSLEISGTDEMKDYDDDNKAPWAELDIEKVIIENGVTSIGKFAFYGCSGLTSVAIPDSVTSIGESAFAFCNNLIIYGNKKSFAHIYAKKNKIKFKKRGFWF